VSPPKEDMLDPCCVSTIESCPPDQHRVGDVSRTPEVWTVLGFERFECSMIKNDSTRIVETTSKG
jgi:hypothetical protein